MNNLGGRLPARKHRLTSETKYEILPDLAISILDEQSELVCRLNAHLDVTFANIAFCRFFGQDRSAIIGRSLTEFIPLQERQSRVSRIKLLDREKPDSTTESRAVALRGEDRWIQWTDKAIFGPNGELDGYQSVGVDVTRRKRVEQALEEFQQKFASAMEESEELNCRIAEFEKAKEDLKTSEERFRELAENIDDVFWVMSLDKQRFIYISPAYEKIWGRSLKEHYERPMSFLEAVHPEDLERVVNAIGQHYDQTSQVEYRIIRPDGEIRWIGARAFPVRNERGEIYRIAGIAEDITQRKQAEDSIKASLREKEILLKEIHHRVKNNLQVISSLLRLQARETTDCENARFLEDCEDRVRTIALVHERLHRSKDLGRIDFSRYLASVANGLFHAYGVDENRIRLAITAQEIYLGIDTAIPCGLIVNELVSNALKHAFPQRRTGAISITLHSDVDGIIVIAIDDDGIGLPENLDPWATASLGLRLVATLVKQVSGEMVIKRTQGTQVQINFKNSHATV